MKEVSNVIDSKVSTNSSNGINQDTGELLSLENSKELSNRSTSERLISNDSKDNEFNGSLEPTELVNHNQKSTISTQTPSSSHV